MAQARVAVEDEAVHLPALALVPVGARVHRHPRLDERASSSSTSALNVTPQCATVDCTCANTWKRPSEPAAPKRHLGRLHRRRRVAAVVVALLRRGLPVDAGDEREVVAVERRAWRPRRRGATRRGGPARRACRTRRRASRTASPSSASKRAQQLRGATLGRAACGSGAASAGGRRRSSAARSLGASGLGRRRRCRLASAQRRSAPRASARPSSSLPMPSFWIRSCSSTMPWSSASGRGGQPGT